jgi:hypothetical protein
MNALRRVGSAHRLGSENRWAKPTLHGVLSLSFLLLLLAPYARADDAPAKENQSLPLLFHEDFKTPESLKRFSFTDPAAWKLAPDDKRPVLSLVQQSRYKPAVRSPVNIAWINDLAVTDFVLQVRCRITRERIPHRDLCFFFGGVDATHFLYAHVAQEGDAVHNQIHLVDGKDRAAVTVKRENGTPWDDAYHTITVTRNAAGTTVAFDDKVLMTTDRKDLPAGRLGVGSFDDLGNFAEITVWGRKADR